MDGLEVKVAFGKTWKDSLTELSGGQKSLLALSLILSLLLFKPAPMYILDEIDAALDPSHTQNIGRIIRSHFSQSQFIIVSLKEGMFNNANVIFKTQFINGQSNVLRTVPNSNELLVNDKENSKPLTSIASSSSTTTSTTTTTEITATTSNISSNTSKSKKQSKKQSKRKRNNDDEEFEDEVDVNNE